MLVLKAHNPPSSHSASSTLFHHHTLPLSVNMEGPSTSSSATASTSSIPHRTKPKRRTLLLSTSLLLASLLAPALASSPPSYSNTSPSERLHETLLLKPLPDGRVLSSFEFTLTSSSASTSNFRLLPRTLLQPVQHFNVSEVHLTLNSGRWRYDSWGSPVTFLPQRSGYAEEGVGKVRIGEEGVGVGAELRAMFDGEDAVGERWKGLTSALAGLFCTSLDALDERHTVHPHHSPCGTIHAQLPTENVCTENLTPFLKLLPCKNAAGLATLLNPLAVFNANFHGLGVHVLRREEGGWEVRLTVTSVFAPAVTRDVSVRDWSMSSLFGRTVESGCPLAEESTVRVLRPEDGMEYVVEPLPKFPACAKPGYGGCRRRGKAYELFPVLDEEDEVTDELASSGLLVFTTTDEAQQYEERLQKRWAHHLTIDGEYLYKLRDGLDVKMSWPHETRFAYPTTNTTETVAVERTLLGTGPRSTLHLTLTNLDTVPVRLLWYETLGYFVKPYLHTLTHNTTFFDSDVLRTPQDYESPLEEVLYQPTRGSKGRGPFVMETVVRVPAKGKVVVEMEVRKVFVRYSQHPPDAHRGFDLNGAQVVVLAPVDARWEVVERQRLKRLRQQSGGRIAAPAPGGFTDRLKHFVTQTLRREEQKIEVKGPKTPSKSQTRIYTLPRLVELATPDFSFVYTNIIFTSTVIALFFGSALNTLLRTFTDFVL